MTTTPEPADFTDVELGRAIVARHQPHPTSRATWCVDCTWPWPCPTELAYRAGRADAATHPPVVPGAD